MFLRLVRYISLLAVGMTMLQGCAFFARKPPLPKQASVERLPRPATETDFAAEVQNADIIYFPIERAASGARSEPAALLLEALEKTQKPYAIGWDMIYASQQPLLDQLETAIGGAREQLITQLDLVASGRAREHCRAVLREARAPGVQYLALRCPLEIVSKVSSGERLTGDEERLLPHGYKAPSGGFEVYLSRLDGGNPADPHLAQSYRAELVRLEFGAEKIVRALRAGGRESKLLVFASADDLDSETGLPYFVMQQVNARQLVLGTNKNQRPKLLTQSNPHIGGDSKS